MPLSADQQATLELVLGRGQSYADLGELLGANEAEVRERARSALAELAGADPDRNVALTDYLLGQADPIARADAVRHLREDPDDRRLASELVGELRELVPEASLPRLPAESRGGRFLRRDPGRAGAPATDGAAAAPAATAGTSRLTRRQSRLVVGLVAGAVLLVAGVLALTGVFSGDEEPAPAPAAEEQPPAPALDEIVLDAPGEAVLRGPVDLDRQPEGADPNEVRVELSAVGDGAGGGEATFGLTGQDTLFVDLELGGLERAGDGETYVLWLMLDRQRGWPLAPIEPDRDGSFSERLDVPATLLPVVAQMQFVTVELTADDDLAELIEGAVGDLAPPDVEPGAGGG